MARSPIIRPTDAADNSGQSGPQPTGGAKESAKGKNADVDGPSNDLEEALKAQARKQVRFSIDILKRLPTENTRGDAPLRRRSIDIRALPIQNPADTATVGREDDYESDGGDNEQSLGEKFTTTYAYNGHEIIIRSTFKDYKMALGPDIQRYGLNLPLGDLDQDLQNRLIDAAEKCTSKEKRQVLMPFAPKTPEGEEAFYDKGVIDYDDFQEMYNTDPEALWQEIKLNALLLTAR
jgi:hypothetical protein